MYGVIATVHPAWHSYYGDAVDNHVVYHLVFWLEENNVLWPDLCSELRTNLWNGIEEWARYA